MSKVAFIFPGQGAQYAGMGEDFYKEIRIFLLKQGKTFQEYVENLIKEDIEKKRGK